MLQFECGILISENWKGGVWGVGRMWTVGKWVCLKLSFGALVWMEL